MPTNLEAVNYGNDVGSRQTSPHRLGTGEGSGAALFEIPESRPRFLIEDGDPDLSGGF